MGMTVRLPRTLLPLVVLPAAVWALTGACGGASAVATHLSSGCHDGRRMALTFDDGPNPPYTGQILDVLANAHALATFFVEGQAVEVHSEIVQREVAIGMAIGSHSYTHGDDLPAMSARDFADDLHRADASIQAAAGFAPALYRAPYGHTGDTMLHVLRTEGYTSIGWDVDSTDWSDAPVDAIVSSVLDQAHPGAIVLMHDGGLGGGSPDRTTTLAALPRIIDGLRGQGYELVTVPDLTGVRESRAGSARQEAACSAS